MIRRRTSTVAGLILSLSVALTGTAVAAEPGAPQVAVSNLEADVVAAVEQPTLAAGQAYLASLGKARSDAVMNYLAQPGAVTEEIIEVAGPPTAVPKKQPKVSGDISAAALVGCSSRTAQIVGKVLYTVVYRFNSQVLWCYRDGRITSIPEHNVYPEDLGAFWQYRGATSGCNAGTTQRVCYANGSFALVSRVVQERYPRIRQVITSNGGYSYTLAGG